MGNAVYSTARKTEFEHKGNKKKNQQDIKKKKSTTMTI